MAMNTSYNINFKMAAPRRRNDFGRMGDGMNERKMMEEEMNRFEQEIQTGQDDDEDDRPGSYSPLPGPPLVPPGIPQALSVLGTPDPNFMNLRFPAPPPLAPSILAPPGPPGGPLTTASGPVQESPSFHRPQLPSGALLRLAGLAPPPPPPPGIISAPATTASLEPPGSFQRLVSNEGQRLPGPSQVSSQPFPPGIQVSGEATPLAPRPAFVPHQVRARPSPPAPAPAPIHRQPAPIHRPPHDPMQHRAPGFLNSVPRPRGPMNFPPEFSPRGPPVGPMVPQRYPMMHPRPMGMMQQQQQSPVVIQAKPTTYSAKPVRFSKSTHSEANKEASGGTRADTVTTLQPGYNVQTPAYTAFTQPTAHHQAPGVYGAPPTAAALAQPAAVNYNTTAQHQQQHQQQQLAEGASGTSNPEQKKKDKKRKFVRTAANTIWEDDSLVEWDPNDFRIFCGDLGNEVTDDLLTKVFGRYPSFTKAKVVRDKRTSKTKGYGFVSFKDPNDFVQAMREWNGKYVGNRPIKLRKSSWKDRNIDTYKKKQKEKQRLGLR